MEASDNINYNIPSDAKRHLDEQMRMVTDYEESVKVLEKIKTLKRKLDTALEAKADDEKDSVNVKDQRAVSYFETCKRQILDRMEEQKKQSQKYIEQLKKYMEQLESAEAEQKSKLLFVEARLTSAVERVEKQKKKTKRTKEEIHLEKEIQELVSSYQKLQPKDNHHELFPWLVSPPPPVYTTPPGDSQKEPLKLPPPEKQEESIEREEQKRNPEETPLSEDIPKPKRGAARAAKRKQVSFVPEPVPEPASEPAPPSPPKKVYSPPPQSAAAAAAPHSEHPETIPEQHPLGYHYNRMSEEEKAFFFTSRPEVFAKIKAMEDFVEPRSPPLPLRLSSLPRPSVPSMPTIIQNTRR